jgi:hypothetical protein
MSFLGFRSSHLPMSTHTLKIAGFAMAMVVVVVTMQQLLF